MAASPLAWKQLPEAGNPAYVLPGPCQPWGMVLVTHTLSELQGGHPSPTPLLPHFPGFLSRAAVGLDAGQDSSSSRGRAGRAGRDPRPWLGSG